MDGTVKRVMLAFLCASAIACGGTPREVAPRHAGEVVVTERVSPNYTVYVIEDEEGIRRLRFERDGVDQSAVVLGDPDQLVFAYMRGLTSALALRPSPARVMVIGLGGGTLPMFLRKHLPKAHIDLVEIDPVVIEVAKKDLGFRDDPEMVVHLADGRRFVETSGDTWDLIVLDAYSAEAIPEPLATREFYEAVRRRLAPGGLCAANVWGDRPNPRYRSMLRTFEAVFPEVHVVAPQQSESRIVLAFQAPEGLTLDGFIGRASELKKAWRLRFDLAAMVKRGHAGPGALPTGGKILVDP